MSGWRRIAAITRKDLRDALRDSRVVVAVLVPVLIGLLYSVMFEDVDSTPSVDVGYATVGKTQLPQMLQESAGGAVEVVLREYGATSELRAAVRDGEADVGIAVPEGFDAGVKAGRSPALLVLLAPSPVFGGDYVASALDRAVQTLSGRGPPAVITVEAVEPESPADQSIMDRLGIREYFVLAAIVMLLAMVAVYAVPIVLSEEVEKTTLDALLMIASPAEVTAAKALFGLVYSLIGVPLMLAITRLFPAQWAAFIAVMALSAVTLVGLGLVLGSLLSNPNQTNTWGTLVLMPLVLPAFIVGVFVTLPGWATVLLEVAPTTHTVRLATNALSGMPLYADAWRSWLVLIAWSIVAYAVVAWRLRTREG